MHRDILTATIGAYAVAFLGVPTLWLVTLGPLAKDMAIHIALMNVAAPAAAILLMRTSFLHARGSRWLWTATVAQLLLLWGAHAPAMHETAMRSITMQAFLWAALSVSALAFWLCVLVRRSGPPWREILALLVTGKLACLLAALLVFAPRPLYGAGHHAAELSDQQLAGLLMLAACPLSYVLAAVVLATKVVTAPASGSEEASSPGFVRQAA